MQRKGEDTLFLYLHYITYHPFITPIFQIQLDIEYITPFTPGIAASRCCGIQLPMMRANSWLMQYELIELTLERFSPIRCFLFSASGIEHAWYH
jgi:hypothetical protein